MIISKCWSVVGESEAHSNRGGCLAATPLPHRAPPLPQTVFSHVKEAKVKMEMQPKLKEAHDQGYAACKQAIVDMREFMKPN